MDFQVQRTQQIKTGSKKPLNYRRNQGGKGLDTTDRFTGYTASDAQQDLVNLRVVSMHQKLVERASHHIMEK